MTNRVLATTTALLLALVLGVACSSGDDSKDSVSTTVTQDPCGAQAPSCAETEEPATSVEHALGDLAFEGVEQDGMSLGSAGAPLQIDVWMNFICSHCGTAAYSVLPEIVDTYVASGDVRLNFRNAALGGDASTVAHEAAACAADQGEFWGAFDILYFNFAEDHTRESVLALFEGSAVDVGQLETCLTGETHRSEIETDVAELESLSARALPVFVIGDQRIEGPETFAGVQQAIDAALGGG